MIAEPRTQATANGLWRCIIAALLTTAGVFADEGSSQDRADLAQYKELAPCGFNFWTTIQAVQPIGLPANFVGENTEAFHEDVVFIGGPLPSPIGNADTIMYREEPLSVGKTIQTRLVAFSNVSAAPIEIKGKGPRAGFYSIHATLSPTKKSTGTLEIVSVEGDVGTMKGTVTLYPSFELRPLAGGRSIFVDSGQQELPGLPLTLSSDEGTWSLDERAVQDHPAPFLTNGFFYTSTINIEYRVDGLLAGTCVKTSASAVSASTASD